jgi:hypothetical protein
MEMAGNEWKMRRIDMNTSKFNTNSTDSREHNVTTADKMLNLKEAVEQVGDTAHASVETVTDKGVRWVSEMPLASTPQTQRRTASAVRSLASLLAAYVDKKVLCDNKVVATNDLAPVELPTSFAVAV